MKNLFLFIASLLATSSATAQNPTATQPDSLLAAQAAQAAPDTVAAIHRLFAARRGRSHILTAVLVGPAVLGLLVDGRNASGGALVYALAASPYELANLICHRRYRKKSEKRAIISFQEHRLSPKISRRLKPKYFTKAPVIRRF